MNQYMNFWKLCYICFVFCVLDYTCQGQGVYVDKGSPYAVGPLEVGELTITRSTKDSPRHVKAFFPLEPGNYGVIYYIGGLSSVVPAEAYTIVLSKISAHGFYVFGVDYYFPVEGRKKLGEDVNIYFEEIEFLKTYMSNKTLGVPIWDDLGLLCHSAGCDDTLKMIEMNKLKFQASGFLEPYSQLVDRTSNMSITIPALMYGTKLSEEGFPPCIVKGYDYAQFYNVWRCPRIAIEVTDFGHCDMLDPVFWDLCHVTRFCKVTNNTSNLNHYRQTVHGIVSSFFMTTLQSRSDALTFISNKANIPINILVDKSDWNC